MHKLGVEEWLVSAVMSMYTGAKTVVRTVYGNSKPSTLSALWDGHCPVQRWTCLIYDISQVGTIVTALRYNNRCQSRIEKYRTGVVSTALSCWLKSQMADWMSVMCTDFLSWHLSSWWLPVNTVGYFVVFLHSHCKQLFVSGPNDANNWMNFQQLTQTCKSCMATHSVPGLRNFWAKTVHTVVQWHA